MGNILHIVTGIFWSISMIICIIGFINTRIKMPHDKFIERNKQLTKAYYISFMIFVILAIICIW